MSDSVPERIAQALGVLPSGERRVAQALTANYPLIGLGPVAEFARAAGVSGPTVLRFVARLGFASYPDFQAALKEELAARAQSPFNRTRTGAPSEQPFLAAIESNLHETFRHLPPRQIDDMARLLADARGRIFLLGGRFTDPAARYLAAHLKIVRPGVIHLTGQESAWADQLIDVGKRDVLVLFDIRRYAPALLRFAATAAARGASIILFTDQWLSPIARHARHVVAGRTAAPSAWDSSIALFAVAELLLCEVTRLAGQTAERRIGEVERLRNGGG